MTRHVILVAALAAAACKPSEPTPAPQTAPPEVTCAAFARQWITLEPNVDPATEPMIASACTDAGDLAAHRAAASCYLAATTAEAARGCNVRPMVDAWFAAVD